MNGWEILGAVTVSVLGGLLLAYLTLVAFWATQMRHVLRGDLELDDESEDN